MRVDEIQQSPTVPEKKPRKQTPQPNGPVTIHDVHILDSSSSMTTANRYRTALAGINNDIQASKETARHRPGLISTMTIVEFGGKDKIKFHNLLTPIESIGTFHSTNFNSMTALYDAIGTTIEKVLTAKAKDDKVLMKIFTDGGENDSQGFYKPIGYDKSSPKLSALMEKVQKEDNFTITFVGTQQDTATMIKMLHVDASNTLVHDNTEHSVKMSFANTTNSRSTFVAKAMAGEDVSKNYYSKTLN